MSFSLQVTDTILIKKNELFAGAYLSLIVSEGISINANNVSPFDQFKTKSLQTRWDLRTTTVVSMNLSSILIV